MGDSPADWAKLGYGGLAIIPFILYKVWQLLKDDKRTDSNTNRIDNFYANLQKNVELMGTRLDAMREENNKLIKMNADLGAKLEVALGEIEDMKIQVTKHMDRVRYLQEILDKAGVNYVRI